MLRKLALSLAVAGILGAGQANALGLGQIRIKSALNEPLDAEIQLLQVRDLDPRQILPKMANTDQFAMAGIDRSRLLSDVNFQVTLNQNGTGSIRLTSSRPVREPFLNLLVEVNWPNGRLVREYTVLLDPPAFQATTIGGGTAPVPAQSAPAVVSAPQPVSAPPARSRGPADNIRTHANPQTQVFVETNDTLGRLAKRYSPGGGTSLNQMMLALQRKNPQAFPNSNINFLKAGVVLDLPSLDEVKSISTGEAANEVARQMQRWKSGSAAQKPSVPQEVGSKKKPLAPADSQAQADAGPQGQLKILSAEAQNTAGQAQDESGVSKVAQAPIQDPEKSELLRRNEELENRLAVTQESVDKIERENTELNDKLTAITQQLETLQRLLELKDQQMAVLQDQLQQVQAAPVPAEPPAPQKPSGLIETVLQTPAYMAALGAVVGGLLVGLIALGRRRREEDALVDETADTPLDIKSKAEESSVAAPVAMAGAATAGATAVWVEDEAELAKLEQAQAGEAEVADLDLDMDLDLDLDLDLPAEEDAAPAAQSAAVSKFGDDEFDLSLDTDFEDDMPPQNQVNDVEDNDFDSSLDDLLGIATGDETEAERANLRSGMGQLSSDVDAVDEPEDTLESLGLDSVIDASNVPKSAGEEVSNYRPGSQVASPDTASSDAQRDAALDMRLSQVAPLDRSQDDELMDAAPKAQAPEPESVADSGLADDITDRVSETEAQAEPEPEAPTQAPEPAVVAEAAFDEDALEFELDNDLVFTKPEQTSDAGDDPREAELAFHSEEPATPEDELDEFEALLAEGAVEPEDAGDELSLNESDDDDLDAMLAALEQGSSEATDGATQGNEDHEIAFEEDTDLDSELEALLGSVDDDIALEESGADDEDHGFDDMGFLDGTDEVETKLDLARAYIDMEDRDGAKDILGEILSEGSDTQQLEARKLMESLT
jgi:pilus assembly protein FimV